LTDPEAQLREYAGRLADGIEAALPGWVTGQVERVATAQSVVLTADVRAATEAAAAEARAAVGGQIRKLLEQDPDDQRTTPLALLRGAVRYPTAVLRDAGAAPVGRDRFAQQSFPDDLYDLSPATFADIDPGLAEPGLEWGAAKAFVHKRRHAPRKSAD
jgi:hypothetical protein